MNEGDGPLSGLRVLDVSTFIAAPFSAALLADFGAEVIKIEMPEGGDTTRILGSSYRGLGLRWAVENRNKKAITLNLSKPEGQEIFRRLVAISDVVLQNFRPGTLERWHLGYGHLKEINPRIVLASISGFGQTGPYRERPAFASIAEAMGGFTCLNGLAGWPPLRTGIDLADYLAGLFTTVGILTSLYWRDAQGSGLGQHIDTALYEAVFRVTEHVASAYEKLGEVRAPAGHRSPVACPAGYFQTGDERWMYISAPNNRLFARLCQAIGQPELARDPRFQTPQERLQNRDELESIIASWTKSRSVWEATEIITGRGVPAGPVYDVRHIFQDPHYAAREQIVEVPDPGLGSLKMQGVVPKLSATPGAVKSIGQPMGEQNEEVYGRLLGMSGEEMARLREAGVI